MKGWNAGELCFDRFLFLMACLDTPQCKRKTTVNTRDRFLYEELPESISVQSISHRGIRRRLEEVVGSAARHHWLASARARVELEARRLVSKLQINCMEDTHKVYFKCSSISMIAAWLPQR
jgi:hypothetical protein